MSDRVVDMKTTTLGRSGLHASRIAFGTWQLGGDWGNFDEDAAVATIRRAIDLGVNVLDTAQGYGFGASERLLGKALTPELNHERDHILIATKGGLRLTDSGLVRDASPEWLRHGADASLAALGVDYIDLYQVHWPDGTVPMSETAGALGDLIAAGKIRHAGVSNFGAAQMDEFSATLPVLTSADSGHTDRRIWALICVKAR
jgi:aryl-alcohol dehydrogenase-like predicted oxidoreductase